MPVKTRNLGVTNTLLGALLLTLVLNPMFANADHQPADKVVAAGGQVIEVDDGDGDTPTEEGTVLLTTEFRTSAPTDLMIHVTLECTILTELTNEGGTNPGRTSFTEAVGRIRVWVEFDGVIVPINDESLNPQPHHEAIGNDDDKVTFCLNERKQALTDAEEDEGGVAGGDGHDTLYTYLRTKQANAFNWIRLNTGNGIHTLEVKADLRTQTAATEDSLASATGFVGNRMLIVEPTKMSNHAKF